jgi:hypothetical protein
MQTNKGQVARSVRFDIATDKNEEFHKLFKNEVLPLLKKQDGFKDELLLVQDQHVLAISVWNNVDSAHKYESGTYPQVDKTLRPVMSGKPTVETYSACRNVTKAESRLSLLDWRGGLGLPGNSTGIKAQGGRKHPHQEFTPVDTTNILFVCGGAFVGLEKIIEKRAGRRSLGFHTDAAPTTPQKRNTELLEQVQPGDLIRYGLIPEFVGRLPVAGVMNDLDKNALVRILTEPKNALLKQYQRLFEFENVRLRFTDDALETVAELALQRKVGARGLRMILEDLMLELMYHLPMQRKVRDFVVSADMVRTREINWSLLEKAG